MILDLLDRRMTLNDADWRYLQNFTIQCDSDKGFLMYLACNEFVTLAFKKVLKPAAIFMQIQLCKHFYNTGIQIQLCKHSYMYTFNSYKP